MTFININPLSHEIKWKVVKLVQFKNYKGDILRKKKNKKTLLRQKGLGFVPCKPPTPNSMS